MVFLPLLTLLFNIVLLVRAEAEFEQYRQLRCTTPDGLTKAGPHVAKCRLVLKDKELEPGRIAPLDDQGCFIESKKESGKSKKEPQQRTLCNLACPNASIWFHSPIEQGHKACFKGLGYGLEERDAEWFIWRSDKCLNSTATFTVGCKWRGADTGLFKNKFPNDKAVFASLAKTKAT